MSAAPRIGLLLLAAGGSGRSGTPKLLLELNGQSLLRRAAEAAVTSEASVVAVVLGANAASLDSALKNLPLRKILNSRWKEGLSSSIRCGVQAISREVDAALIMLADQPLISTDILNRLMGAFRTGERAIVASAYGQTVGVPAIFGASVFSDLLNLTADRGAKDLIRVYGDAMLTVSVPEAAVDIDTEEDLDRLKHQLSSSTRP